LLVADVSVKLIGPNFKGKTIQEKFFFLFFILRGHLIILSELLDTWIWDG
jgi:hypothetical protein